jgi:chemotaxis protein MotB
MFWLRRLKQADADPDAGWALSYGDLMSLLMAVFVMIAAMSELKVGPRFEQARGAVQSAFGFAPEPALPDLGPVRPQTLAEKLRLAGFQPASTWADAREALAGCDFVSEPDRLTIRIAGPSSFEAMSARLRTKGEAAAQCLAGFLAGGQLQIEIRGHAGDGPLPPAVPFRDPLDLSYARARAVADIFVRVGVAPERIRVTACGDTDPLIEGAGPEGANRRVEIVVRATAAPATQAKGDGGQDG